MYIFYTMPNKRKSINKRDKRKNMRGGDGSADWATKVYGGPGQQTAAAGSNVIKMSLPGGCQAGGGVADNAAPVDAVTIKATPVAVMKGGNAVSDDVTGQVEGSVPGVIKGGNTLTEVAVPAVLLTVNQLYKRRTNKKGGKTNKKARRTANRRRN